MFITGNHNDAAKDEMYRYLELNKDELERSLKRLCSIVYTMEKLDQHTLVRITSVTKPLLEHESVKIEGSKSDE